MAEAKAVPSNNRKVDFTFEPLKTPADKRLKILVRSKAKEHNTNNTRVTRPGLTALVKMSSTLTNDSAKHNNIVTEKTRSGTWLYLTKLIKVAKNTPIINHCSIVIMLSVHRNIFVISEVFNRT
jgi:hypothetical protein